MSPALYSFLYPIPKRVQVRIYLGSDSWTRDSTHYLDFQEFMLKVSRFLKSLFTQTLIQTRIYLIYRVGSSSGSIFSLSILALISDLAPSSHQLFRLLVYHGPGPCATTCYQTYYGMAGNHACICIWLFIETAGCTKWVYVFGV